jgi:hypothetical protein
VKGLNFPAHAIPLEFLNGILARTYRQVRDQLPVDLLSPLRRASFLRVDDGERKFRILFLFADGRKNPNPALFDFH